MKAFRLKSGLIAHVHGDGSLRIGLGDISTNTARQLLGIFGDLPGIASTRLKRGKRINGQVAVVSLNGRKKAADVVRLIDARLSLLQSIGSRGATEPSDQDLLNQFFDLGRQIEERNLGSFGFWPNMSRASKKKFAS